MWKLWVCNKYMSCWKGRAMTRSRCEKAIEMYPLCDVSAFSITKLIVESDFSLRWIFVPRNQWVFHHQWKRGPLRDLLLRPYRPHSPQNFITLTHYVLGAMITIKQQSALLKSRTSFVIKILTQVEKLFYANNWSAIPIFGVYEDNILKIYCFPS